MHRKGARQSKVIKGPFLAENSSVVGGGSKQQHHQQQPVWDTARYTNVLVGQGASGLLLRLAAELPCTGGNSVTAGGASRSQAGRPYSAVHRSSPGQATSVMGLLTHIKLGLENIEAEAVSSTTTSAPTTTMAAVTEAVGEELDVKSGDQVFDIGEALRLIG